jgi:hypothetical protein
VSEGNPYRNITAREPDGPDTDRREARGRERTVGIPSPWLPPARCKPKDHGRRAPSRGVRFQSLHTPSTTKPACSCFLR